MQSNGLLKIKMYRMQYSYKKIKVQFLVMTQGSFPAFRIWPILKQKAPMLGVTGD